MKRIDENGPDALLQLREPGNKFPDFVRYIVQRLKTLSPSMGKLKIAETLCRARPHLGITTVGRIVSVVLGFIGVLFTGLVVAVSVRAVREGFEETEEPD